MTEKLTITSDDTNRIVVHHEYNGRTADDPVTLPFLVVVAFLNLLENGTISAEIDRILAESRANGAGST